MFETEGMSRDRRILNDIVVVLVWSLCEFQSSEGSGRVFFFRGKNKGVFGDRILLILDTG